MSDTPHIAPLARRGLLRSGAAALALASTGGATRAGAPAASASITRAKFAFPSDVVLPHLNTAYIVPYSEILSTDSDDCTLLPDSTLRINTAGLYRLIMSGGWVAGRNLDTGLRTYGIRVRRHAALAAASFGVQPNVLTPVNDIDEKVVTVDMPGSKVPKTARYSGAWTPGAVGPGAVVSTDVTLDDLGFVGLGDVVLAAHTSIADGVIGGPAAAALFISGRVIAPDVVRVSLYNPTAGAITLPEGTLQLVAMSTTATTGQSADAWTVLQTTTLDLAQGDLVYGLCRSATLGDTFKAGDSNWIQVERWG